MREIKFRGKRLDNGEWVEGDLFNAHAEHHSPNTCICTNEYHPVGYGSKTWYTIDTSTIGQFTGLTDKNGKEIFEGDILKKEPFLKVVYENGGFCFANDFYSGSDRISQDRVVRLEVIGNIHDNPDLIHS